MKILILKKMGIRTKTKISVDELLDSVNLLFYSGWHFKLQKNKGRAKKIYHRAFVDEICVNENLTYDKILFLNSDTKKEILGEFYGKWFMEKKDFNCIWEYVKENNITKVMEGELINGKRR